MIEFLLSLIFLVFGVWLVLWLYIFLPAEMARDRGRSALAWVLVSLIASPILAILLLWLVGPADQS